MRGLRVEYGGTVAVEDLDLHAADREFQVILGPSGSGKTTVLRCIAGLTEATRGSILIDGRDVTDLYPSERSVAMVFQNLALYPHMTVFDNIALNLRMRHLKSVEIARRVEDVTQKLDIGDLLGRRPRELSGGQAQRVGLARAMVRDPAIYLMDEPLSSLDAKLRGEMLGMLRSFHELVQKTIVYVTHDQTEAMSLGDRIVVMNKGRKAQEGAPTEVYDRPANVFVAEFVGSPPMNTFPARAVPAGDSTYDLSWTGSRSALRVRLEAGRLPLEIRLGVRPSDLRLDPSGPIVATLDRADFLGPSVEAQLTLGEVPLVVRIPRIEDPEDRVLRSARGTDIRFGIAPGGLHLFDAASGNRLDVPIVAASTP